MRLEDLVIGLIVLGVVLTGGTYIYFDQKDVWNRANVTISTAQEDIYAAKLEARFSNFTQRTELIHQNLSSTLSEARAEEQSGLERFVNSVFSTVRVLFSGIVGITAAPIQAYSMIGDLVRPTVAELGISPPPFVVEGLLLALSSMIIFAVIAAVLKYQA